MSILEAIKALERIKRQHGEDVKVFFDCPNCGRSFAPDGPVTKAVHIATVPPDQS